MSFCRTIRILPLMLLGLSAFAAATPASAKTFLEELQGSWRGLGTPSITRAEIPTMTRLPAASRPNFVPKATPCR